MRQFLFPKAIVFSLTYFIFQSFTAGHLFAQTNPAAHNLSAGAFTFTGQVATSTTYPTSLQGWQNSVNNIDFAELVPASNDAALVASGTVTTAGLSNLGADGFQFYNTGSGTSRKIGSLCVALNATNRFNVSVSWTAQDRSGSVVESGRTVAAGAGRGPVKWGVSGGDGTTGLSKKGMDECGPMRRADLFVLVSFCT